MCKVTLDHQFGGAKRTNPLDCTHLQHVRWQVSLLKGDLTLGQPQPKAVQIHTYVEISPKK